MASHMCREPGKRNSNTRSRHSYLASFGSALWFREACFDIFRDDVLRHAIRGWNPMSKRYPSPKLAHYLSYEQACREFRWRVPRRFNIAEAICRKHKDAVTRLALAEIKPAGENYYTFNALDFLSDKFATVLRNAGIQRNQHVAVILAQSASSAIAQLAALKLGGVVVPLTVLLSPSDFEYRLKDSNSRAIIVDASARSKLEQFLESLPSLEVVFIVNDGVLQSEAAGSDRDFWRDLNAASSDFDIVETDSDAPAFVFYTSASESDPKGVVHSHSSLLGHLPAFEMFNNLDIGNDTVFWTPADWACIESLMNLIYPAWYYGRPVIAHEIQEISSEKILARMADSKVTNAYIPAAALQMMRGDMNPGSEHDLRLKTIYTGGEPLKHAAYDWARDSLGASINQIYGHIEASALVCNCEKWFSTRPGSVGKPVPGHIVDIIEKSSDILSSGETGRIAPRRPDPALFLEYLNQPEQTARAFENDWLITGDRGFKDAEGYIWVCPVCPK